MIYLYIIIIFLLLFQYGNRFFNLDFNDVFPSFISYFGLVLLCNL